MRRVGPMHNPAGGHVVTRFSLGGRGRLKFKKKQYLTAYWIYRFSSFFVFAQFNRVFVVSICGFIYTNNFFIAVLSWLNNAKKTENLIVSNCESIEMFPIIYFSFYKIFSVWSKKNDSIFIKKTWLNILYQYFMNFFGKYKPWADILEINYKLLHYLITYFW
jgi:hypothetical protein